MRWRIKRAKERFKQWRKIPKAEKQRRRNLHTRFKQIIRHPDVSRVIAEYLGLFDRKYKREWCTIQPKLRKAMRALDREGTYHSPSETQAMKQTLAYREKTWHTHSSKTVQIGNSEVTVKMDPYDGTLTILPTEINGQYDAPKKYVMQIAYRQIKYKRFDHLHEH